MIVPGLPNAAATTPRAAPGPVDRWSNWRQRDTLIVSLLVGLTVVRGLLFASVQWPWYAPDEPDHVEFALLIQRHGPLVGRDLIDPALRLSIATSLYDWRVYQRPPAASDALAAIWSGEIGRQPPLYYLLASSAAALAPAGDLLAQLYAMRTVSAVIGGLIVAALYLAGRLIQPASAWPALGLAGVGLFQTPLGALGGAVTNDGLAVLAVTLVLVVGVALVRRPLSGRAVGLGIGALAVALLMALLTKRTALPALPASLLALTIAGIGVARRPLVTRGWAWPALAVLAVAVIATLFAALEPATSRVTTWTVANGTRVALPDAVDGDHGLLLGANGAPASVTQQLTDAWGETLRDQSLTLGVWLRLAEPGPPRPVALRIRSTTRGRRATEMVRVLARPDWQFATVGTNIAPDASTMIVSVLVESSGGGVLVDRLQVARGAAGRPATATIEPSRAVGWQGGAAFDGLSNASFEAAPLGLRPWLSQLVQALVNRDPGTIFDLNDRADRLPNGWEEWQLRIWEPFFVSLWGRLGRSAELAMPPWWYTAHALLLIAATIGTLIGGLLGLWRRASGRTLAVVAVLLTGIVGSVVVVLGPYVLALYPGFPSGRYFLPALLPLAGVYIWGLVMIWPQRLQGVALLALLSLLAALDSYVLFYALPAHFTISGPR